MAKILIAEDDVAEAKVYERAFSLSGHIVEVVNDGEEVFKKLKEAFAKPDVIVLDMVMPNLGGLGVIQRIKEDPEWENFKNIPIVLLTNLPKLSGSDDVRKAMDKGAEMYLLKSMYDPVAIVKKVEGIIIKSGGF